MKQFLSVLAVLVCLGTSAESALAKGDPVISLDQLKQMFTEMRSHPGYKKWNVDGPLLWGYFFTDPSPRKLQALADHLSRNGYRFVAIFLTDDKRTQFLHVEKVERHTPESLHRRNLEFYELADRFKLESYDGMDVGPVEK